MTNTTNIGNTRQENNQDGKHANFLPVSEIQAITNHIYIYVFVCRLACALEGTKE